MKKRSFHPVAACVGAVIGAGFASGREMISFFTRYGSRSWWLIALTVVVMTALCWLCGRESQRTGCSNWCELFAEESRWLRMAVRWCSMLLMMLVGGAMVSAAGHMSALLWPGKWAYSVGASITLLTAWQLGFGNLKPLGWLSSVMTAALVVVMLILLGQPMTDQAANVTSRSSGVIWAAFRAVGYAAMNMTLAIGVVCKSARTVRKSGWMSMGFGTVMGVLMCLGNHLYSLHSETADASFPVVRLLSAFGRQGFLASALLLYLAVFTTLCSVLYSLRCAVESSFPAATCRHLLVPGLPLLASCAGFEGIVDSLYAPAGWMCLGVIFTPLIYRHLTQR